MSWKENLTTCTPAVEVMRIKQVVQYTALFSVKFNTSLLFARELKCNPRLKRRNTRKLIPCFCDASDVVIDV